MSSCKSVPNLACRVAIVLIVSVLAGSINCAQDETKKEFDPAQLRGQWKYVDGKRAGEQASDENLADHVVIEDKQLKIVGETETFVISYQLNTKKNPVEIDLQIVAGPVPEGKAIGIIKMSGDKFTLCYDPTGAKRPDKFESAATNGWHLFELAKKEFDIEQLVGKWKYESGERAGEIIEAERLQSVVTISKDKFNVPAGPDAEFVMAYQLDAQKSPVTIDLSIESGPAPEGKALGILKIADGKLWLCYDSTGAKRPADFNTTAEDGFFLFELSKQEKDPEKKDETKKSEPTPANKK